MLHPRTGTILTTASPQAAQHYLDAVDLILGSESGAKAQLDEALTLDPDFAMAMAARYMLAKDANDPAANDYGLKARTLAGRAGPRERAHIEVLTGWLEAKALARAG